MLVRDLMNTKLVTVELDDQLSVVKEIFDHLHIHHLVVIEDNKVFGIISDRDLFKALSPHIGTIAETGKDAATLNKRVHQIASRHPITLTADAPLKQAIDIFDSHGISCVPVVDHEQKPIGIITTRDIIHALNKKMQTG